MLVTTLPEYCRKQRELQQHLDIARKELWRGMTVIYYKLTSGRQLAVQYPRRRSWAEKERELSESRATNTGWQHGR